MSFSLTWTYVIIHVRIDLETIAHTIAHTLNKWPNNVDTYIYILLVFETETRNRRQGYAHYVQPNIHKQLNCYIVALSF